MTSPQQRHRESESDGLSIAGTSTEKRVASIFTDEHLIGISANKCAAGNFTDRRVAGISTDKRVTGMSIEKGRAGIFSDRRLAGMSTAVASDDQGVTRSEECGAVGATQF